MSPLATRIDLIISAGGDGRDILCMMAEVKLSEGMVEAGYDSDFNVEGAKGIWRAMCNAAIAEAVGE